MEHLGAVELECETSVGRLMQGLTAAGLHAMRSFDLQSARRSLRDPDGCPCPYHGTVDCTCQYIVLLVTSGDSPPVTLVAHGHDGTTHVSADGLDAAGPAGEIVRAGVDGLAALPSPGRLAAHHNGKEG